MKTNMYDLSSIVWLAKINTHEMVFTVCALLCQYVCICVEKKLLPFYKNNHTSLELPFENIIALYVVCSKDEK